MAEPKARQDRDRDADGDTAAECEPLRPDAPDAVKSRSR
jgi:hypothetical protein